MTTMDDMFRQRGEMTKADKATACRNRHEAKLVGWMRHIHGNGPASAVCGDCQHLTGIGV